LGTWFNMNLCKSCPIKDTCQAHKKHGNMCSCTEFMELKGYEH